MLNMAASLIARHQPVPEEAARLGLEVMGVPDGQRTKTVRKRGAELLEFLGRWRTTPAVKDFTEGLREYRLPQPPHRQRRQDGCGCSVATGSTSPVAVSRRPRL